MKFKGTATLIYDSNRWAIFRLVSILGDSSLNHFKFTSWGAPVTTDFYEFETSMDRYALQIIPNQAKFTVSHCSYGFSSCVQYLYFVVQPACWKR